MISLLRKALFFMLFMPLFWYGPAASQQDAARSERFITIDFENVDINLFIKYISELTGRNFIIDKTVKGNVTIISPTKISEDEAYSVFLSVLDVHGYTTVEAGAVTKIVPAVKARSENIPTFQSDARQPPEDKVVTQLIPLKHTSPDEVKKILAPLVSKTSVMIAHTHSGILIVTDTLSNIQRLISIIEVIDIPDTGEEIAVLPLEFASAEAVSKVMLSLFQQARATPQGVRAETSVKIVPYDRTNALIIAATPTNIERVSRLVKLLDTEMRQDSGNIHVHYLQHASAEEMAKVLNFLPTQSRQSSAAGQQEAPGPAPAISGEVKIMADEETNSLLINASRSEYDVLADVIAKLDIPRRMVYLEALILEVNTTKNFEVGVEWGLGGRFSDETGTVVSGFSGGAVPFGVLEGVGEYSPPATTGVTFGVIKQGIKIGGVTFPNIGAVLRAYKNDSDINIVATPQILTTDNKEAEISVGENVPYITSRNTTDAEQDYTNYEYRDVSTTLKITPQINQAETLRLEIATEVIKLQSADNDTPTTFKRTAKTTVIVKNNETVVIGGIIGQDGTRSITKVPLLGDIPLLGQLFRSDTSAETETNMFIFITPRIIKNPADLVDVTLKKEEQMDTVMPDIKKDLFHEANIGHATHLAEIGFDKMAAGLNSEAKQYFQEALDSDPQNPYALYNLGVIHEEEGDRKAAEIHYRKVILTGTTMTAVNTREPGKVGKPLLQLARERLEALQKVETEQRRPFELENSR